MHLCCLISSKPAVQVVNLWALVCFQQLISIQLLLFIVFRHVLLTFSALVAFYPLLPQNSLLGVVCA